MYLSLAIRLLLICGFLSATNSSPSYAKSAELSLNTTDYEAAAVLDNPRLSTLVRNATIKPHWIDNEDRFWYRRDTDAGTTVVIIDAKTGERSSAYDVGNMVDALRDYVETPIEQDAAVPIRLTAERGQMEAEFKINGQQYICRLAKPKCRLVNRENRKKNLL